MTNAPNFPILQREDQQKADHNVLDQYKDLTVEQRIEITRSRESDFAVALMNITGDLNTGTIIRTAHLMGAKEVLIFGRNRVDRRSTVGAENYTPVSYFGGLQSDLTVDPNVFKEALNDRGYCPIFVETGEFCVTKVDFVSKRRQINKPFCFVLGNEGRGIDAGVMSTKNDFSGSFNVSIPQRGVMRSYNVAGAAAMVLYAYNNSIGWE